MPLSPAQPRALAHTRSVHYQGFQREDGLWDIEGHMRDTKPVVFDIPGEHTWQPDEPIHDMQIRVTVDTNLVVQAIEVAMNNVPHGECPKASAPMQKMVGTCMARGWRKAIDLHLGNEQGCTHLRELLFNLATAAFQSIQGTFAVKDLNTPPPHLGRCLAWGFNSPLVERRYPMFFKWPEKKPPL